MARFHYPAAALCVAATMLAGCGGSQPLIGNTGAMPQGRAIAQQAAHGKSWMLPEAKAQDLVYFSTETGSGGPSTYILSLPRGKLVGQLSVSGRLCSDNVGNVWIVEGSNPYEKGKLLEYAHGGDKPIRTLHPRHMAPGACAVDPTSGNLAVINDGHKVDIYNTGSSQPKTFAYKKLYFDGLTYDNSGNLFILGGTVNSQKPQKLEVAEMPKGATKFETLRGFQTDRLGHSGFEWDGKHLTLGDSLNEGGHEIFPLRSWPQSLKEPRGSGTRHWGFCLPCPLLDSRLESYCHCLLRLV